MTHFTEVIGIDMKWFTKDVMKLINHKNGKCYLFKKKMKRFKKLQK